MMLMGLDDLVADIIPHVANLKLFRRPAIVASPYEPVGVDLPHYVPFFETTIRYLGGLLSAYAMSGNPVLLARADDLGRALLPAFNTTSGLPSFAVDVISWAFTCAPCRLGCADRLSKRNDSHRMDGRQPHPLRDRNLPAGVPCAGSLHGTSGVRQSREWQNFAPLDRTTTRLQVDFITDHLRTVNHTDGLFPVTFSQVNGLPFDSEC
jgi:hypothetical protein